MPKYKVHVLVEVEPERFDVEVEADTPDEAREIVEEGYWNGTYHPEYGNSGMPDLADVSTIAEEVK